MRSKTGRICSDTRRQSAKKEGEGPLGERFDYVAKNDRMGQRSWELAESELQKTAIRLALRKATLPSVRST